MARIMLTMPDELLNAVDEAARAQHRSRSEFMREAARARLEQSSLGNGVMTDNSTLREQGVAYIAEREHFISPELLERILTLLQQAKVDAVEQSTISRAPRDLSGIWADAFPDDFDIDAVLNDVRSGWQNDLDDMVGVVGSQDE